MTFKEYPFICSSCAHTFKEFKWDHHPHPSCPACKLPDTVWLNYPDVGQSSAVIGDEIDIVVRHAICNEDGSPRRYRSMTELRRVANERGYTIHGDSPKPYKVNWSGVQKRVDGVKPDAI